MTGVVQCLDRGVDLDLLGERQGRVELESDLLGDLVEPIVGSSPSESRRTCVRIRDGVVLGSAVMVVGPSHDDGLYIFGPLNRAGGVEWRYGLPTEATNRLRKRGDVRRVVDGGLEISGVGVENIDIVGESIQGLNGGIHELLDAWLVRIRSGILLRWHVVDDRRSGRTGRRKPVVSS